MQKRTRQFKEKYLGKIGKILMDVSKAFDCLSHDPGKQYDPDKPSFNLVNN